jgi:DNA-directed RNA polymerase specialized sigma24 family protein
MLHHWLVCSRKELESAMGRGKLGEPGEIPCTRVESWAVAEALASLRPDHRDVLVETFYRGRSVAEAAVTLGLPPGTVKSRAFYALKALKLALQERELGPG